MARVAPATRRRPARGLGRSKRCTRLARCGADSEELGDPEQCGACCISKAVHPGDNVETFAAKFRYMRSPGEAAGRRLDVVGRAAVQVLKNRSVDP